MNVDWDEMPQLIKIMRNVSRKNVDFSLLSNRINRNPLECLINRIEREREREGAYEFVRLFGGRRNACQLLL